MLHFLLRLIHLSSPIQNYLMGGGAFILYIDIIAPTADPYSVVILCNVRTLDTAYFQHMTPITYTLEHLHTFLSMVGYIGQA